jgi:hypothetical protein
MSSSTNSLPIRATPEKRIRFFPERFAWYIA